MASKPKEATATATSSWVLQDMVKLDAKLSEKIHNIFQPIIPRTALKVLEITGDGRLWFPISISLLLAPLPHHSPNLYTFLLSLLIGLLSDILIIGLLKHLIRRQRPHYNPVMGATLPVDHWSFPSGHASRVFFIATLFAICRDSDRIIGVLLWIWALLTSFSRVLLGRHFVFDVVVGASVGVFNAFFVFRFLRFY